MNPNKVKEFLTPSENEVMVLCEKNGKTEHVNPGQLVQPLGSLELLAAVGGMYGTMNTVQAIWLTSKVPFEIEEVFQALRIASSRVPHLHFCLARRGISLWFKRMEEYAIDFDISTNDTMDVYEEMLEYKFDLWQGPLWKVRLVIPNANTVFGGSEGSYTFVLLFCVHHVITDGFTNMTICREVVSIINQMKAGKTTIIPKPIPVYPIKDDSLMDVQPFSFYIKYVFEKLWKCPFSLFSKDMTFKGRIPLPETSDSKTKVLFDELTCEETANLFRQCKNHKITINTCITMIANFSLLEVAQSKSSSKMGQQTIYTIHNVNTRRYYPTKYKNATGYHVSYIEDECKMSLSDGVNFWDLAREIQWNMNRHLETEKNHLKILPLVRLMVMTFPLNNFLTKSGRKNRTDCHYISTNMGNLKSFLPDPKEGDCIEITNVLRSAPANTLAHPFLLTFHTFRDKLQISIDYSSNKMKHEIAQMFFKTLCFYLKNLANHGSIYDLQ